MIRQIAFHTTTWQQRYYSAIGKSKIQIPLNQLQGQMKEEYEYGQQYLLNLYEQQLQQLRQQFFTLNSIREFEKALQQTISLYIYDQFQQYNLEKSNFQDMIKLWRKYYIIWLTELSDEQIQFYCDKWSENDKIVNNFIDCFINRFRSTITIKQYKTIRREQIFSEILSSYQQHILSSQNK